MSMSVCVFVFVCLSVKISLEQHVRSLTNFFHVACGRCSVLLCHRCNMSCSFSFVDDIMFFFYYGPYSGMNFAMKD